MPISCVCLVCQRVFTVPPAKIRLGKGKFCSVQCHNQRRSRKPPAERFWRHVTRTETCWLWTAACYPSGYGAFRLDGRTLPAHRIAYELTYGPIPPELFCCHHCDVRPCVRPEHLFVGTRSDNMQDMVRKGRHGWAVHPENALIGERHMSKTHPGSYRRGENHSHALLSDAQVLEIRRLRAEEHWTQIRLAEAFGVSRGTICNIVINKTWRHLLSR